MLTWSKNVDFSDVKGHIHNYARQENIDTNRMKKFLAAMLHYDLDVSALIRFLGLIYQYYRIFLTGNILRRKQAESPKNWTPPRDFFSTFSVVFVCRFRNHLAEMPNNGMNGQPIVRFNQYGGLYDHGRPFPRSKWVLLSLFYESEVYEYGCCSARRLATIIGVSVKSALKAIDFFEFGMENSPSGVSHGHGYSGPGSILGLQMEHHAFIYQLYVRNPSKPTAGYVQDLFDRFGVTVSNTTIHRWFMTIGPFKGTMRVTSRFPGSRNSSTTIL